MRFIHDVHRGVENNDGKSSLIYVNVDAWLLRTLSLSLLSSSFPPSSPSFSSSGHPLLHTVPGLYCAHHDEACDSVNGCDDVSYCDHLVNLTHNPARHCCLTTAHLIDGEFHIQVCFKLDFALFSTSNLLFRTYVSNFEVHLTLNS